MPHVLGQVAGRPPRAHGGRIPGLGHKQPPVQRAAGLLGDRVDRHPELAVGRLAQRARVLALYPHRVVAVFGKAGVIHRPRDRLQRTDQPGGQPPADRPPIPRAGRNEVVQRLVVHLAQALGHRLDRLAAPIQHQPAQVALPTGTLVLARQRLQDVSGERLQAPAESGQLGRCDACHPAPSADRKGGFTHTLTDTGKPDRALLKSFAV